MAKSGLTGMYAIPTETSAKFPEEYLERTISQIKYGEHVVVAASAFGRQRPELLVEA